MGMNFKTNFICFIKKRLPEIAIAAITLTILINDFQHSYWNQPMRVIESDVKVYYAYLPAVFIYHDLSFSFVDNNKEIRDKLYLIKSNTGKKTVLTTMGLSIMYAPFFLIAQATSPLIGYKADGITPPFKFALVISALFYVVFGLFFLSKVLLKYFSKTTITITLLSIVLGTNLFYYTTREAPMSHAYSFSLICIFLYFTIKWHESPTYKKTIIIGLLAGLIVLIRPSNIVVLVLFILWNISTIKELLARPAYFLRVYRLIILMILSFFIIWIPQFIYWKFVSGSFLFNAYEYTGGKFFFNNPQIYNFLFSYRKGWLLYTPIMILALTGILALRRQAHGLFIPILVFVLINLYIISSWYSWWYGGGFSQRAMVDTYGVMAISLASFLKWTFDRKHYLKFGILTILVLLITFNLFQTKQYNNGAIHFVAMTKESYWETFGKLHPTNKYYEDLVWPDYVGAMKGKYYTAAEMSEKQKNFKNNRIGELTEEIKNEARNNPSLMESLEKDTARFGVSVDSMIHLKAIWKFEQQENMKGK